MVREIRIFIEGGGDKNEGKKALREGFADFFRQNIPNLGQKRIKFRSIPCGSRKHAYKNFRRALIEHPNAFNVLLVDSEGPVRHTPLKHLNKQDNWKMAGVGEGQCHLMVQMMEAWLIADIETLKSFYGQDFNTKAIPKNPNVENITKNKLESALKTATLKTQKGRYHKILHAPKILSILDVKKVRKAAPHCERLFKTLEEKIGEP